MTASLTVHNAEITTASVQIQTLTISGKQVTLAVFRQLPQDARHRLIDDDGTFNGTPWGTVNYHSKRCRSDPHMHVVWQDGDILRHDSVTEFLWQGWVAGSSAAGDLILADGTYTEEPVYFGDRTEIRTKWQPPEYCRRDGADLDFSIDVGGHTYNVWVRDNLAIPDDIDTHKAGRQSYLDAVVQEVTARRDLEHRRLSRWAELEALPQLYIAV